MMCLNQNSNSSFLFSVQAIAWRTAAHRFTQDAYDNVSRNMAASPTVEAQINHDCELSARTREPFIHNTSKRLKYLKM